MDIRKELLQEHSKANKDRIAAYLIKHPDGIDGLMKLFFGEDTRLVQHAAWVVGTLGEQAPSLITPFFPAMIGRIKRKEAKVAFRRNVFRVMQFQRIDEALWGDVYDLCIDILMNKTEPIAVKVFAMSTALNIVKELPELKNELKIAVEDVVENGSKGEVSRGQKVLAALSKL